MKTSQCSLLKTRDPSILSWSDLEKNNQRIFLRSNLQLKPRNNGTIYQSTSLVYTGGLVLTRWSDNPYRVRDNTYPEGHI